MTPPTGLAVVASCQISPLSILTTDGIGAIVPINDLVDSLPTGGKCSVHAPGQIFVPAVPSGDYHGAASTCCIAERQHYAPPRAVHGNGHARGRGFRVPRRPCQCRQSDPRDDHGGCSALLQLER